MSVRLTETQEEIIKELHEQYGGNIEELRQIIDTQSLLVKKVFEAGEYHAIRLPYFGLFKATPYMVQKINRTNAAKRRKLQGKG